MTFQNQQILDEKRSQARFGGGAERILQQHQKAERRQMKLRKSRRNEIFNTEQRIRD